MYLLHILPIGPFFIILIFKGWVLFLWWTGHNLNCRGAGMSKILVGTSLCGGHNLPFPPTPPFDWNRVNQSPGVPTSPYVPEVLNSESKSRDWKVFHINFVKSTFYDCGRGEFHDFFFLSVEIVSFHCKVSGAVTQISYFPFFFMYYRKPGGTILKLVGTSNFRAIKRSKAIKIL